MKKRIINSNSFLCKKERQPVLKKMAKEIKRKIGEKIIKNNKAKILLNILTKRFKRF